ncbi:hypothetical protein Tco_1101743 [Tanacetum coccineum]
MSLLTCRLKQEANSLKLSQYIGGATWRTCIVSLAAPKSAFCPGFMRIGLQYFMRIVGHIGCERLCVNLKGYEKTSIIHSLARQHTAFCKAKRSVVFGAVDRLRISYAFIYYNKGQWAVAGKLGDDDTTAFLHLCFCNYNDLLGWAVMGTIQRFDETLALLDEVEHSDWMKKGTNFLDPNGQRRMENELYELTLSTTEDRSDKITMVLTDINHDSRANWLTGVSSMEDGLLTHVRSYARGMSLFAYHSRIVPCLRPLGNAAINNIEKDPVVSCGTMGAKEYTSPTNAINRGQTKRRKMSYATEEPNGSTSHLEKTDMVTLAPHSSRIRKIFFK